MKITMLEIGNWLMVLCAAFYLAWWRITFRPPAPAGTPIGKICLLLAFVTGLAGLSLAVISMNSVSGEKATFFLKVMLSGDRSWMAMGWNGELRVYRPQRKRWMIGDRENDVTAANEVGIDSIGVLYGYGDKDELTSAGATYLAENVFDIRSLI